MVFQENAEELQLYQDALEFEGHEVLALSKPEKLLDSTTEWQPDLLFLDSHYQSQAIETFVQKVRESSTPELPIVIVVEDSEFKNKQNYLDWGVQKVVSKPIEYDQLTLLIQQLI